MLPRRTLANAIRALSMDAVQKANSGHPGMPMGMSDIGEVLWNDFLRHNPLNPLWPNRDRFILSNGHGCLLQYCLLHLSGYNLSIEDIKQFRQLHSKTPGHPEYGFAPGIETTTGPLGQGFGNAVGMALAEAILAETFNREGHPIIDHYTYCFVGDGCLMEGISHEVGSLAGTLGLGKLIVFWDDNGISIDGKVSGWWQDDTPKRFESYGWQVIPHIDGHNPDALKKAIQEAQANTQKPSLLCCKTIIGFGAPNASGTEKSHGQALGEKEVQLARESLKWDYPPFEIPKEIYEAFDARKKGQHLEEDWKKNFAEYQKAFPFDAKELSRRWDKELPNDWQDIMEKFITSTGTGTETAKKEKIATRKASQITLEIMQNILPELIGGSADLSESNLTSTKFSKVIAPHQFNGNYIHYGVREFGMAAIMNGIALYGGFIPFGGTFLTFLDYARNAVRLSALMGQRVIYVFTHDSVGLGEDGPTHQPAEHLGILRTTPNMSLWRPCDLTETAIAWVDAIENQDGPTSLALTRQPVNPQVRTREQIALIRRGGYILKDCEGTPEAIIISTGSEVDLAIQAADVLTQQGKKIRVVSMPSTNIFQAQDPVYQEAVLPKAIRARVAVEAAATNYWYQWVGLDGKVVGIDRYGESAPAKEVFNALGMTVEAVVHAVETVLNSK